MSWVAPVWLLRDKLVGNKIHNICTSGLQGFEPGSVPDDLDARRAIRALYSRGGALELESTDSQRHTLHNAHGEKARPLLLRHISLRYGWRGNERDSLTSQCAGSEVPRLKAPRGTINHHPTCSMHVSGAHCYGRARRPESLKKSTPVPQEDSAAQAQPSHQELELDLISYLIARFREVTTAALVQAVIFRGMQKRRVHQNNASARTPHSTSHQRDLLVEETLCIRILPRCG